MIISSVGIVEKMITLTLVLPYFETLLLSADVSRDGGGAYAERREKISNSHSALTLNRKREEPTVLLHHDAVLSNCHNHWN